MKKNTKKIAIKVPHLQNSIVFHDKYNHAYHVSLTDSHGARKFMASLTC